MNRLQFSLEYLKEFDPQEVSIGSHKGQTFQQSLNQKFQSNRYNIQKTCAGAGFNIGLKIFCCNFYC